MFRNIIEYLSTRILSHSFRKHRRQCILQCLVVFVCISAIIALSTLLSDIIVASFGASCLILFVTPHSEGSRFRHVFGGYICGLVSGMLFNHIYFALQHDGVLGSKFVLIITCGAAVAVAVFMMVIFYAEHPPAAALALGLTFEPRLVEAALVTLISIGLLCAIHRWIKKHFINL